MAPTAHKVWLLVFLLVAGSVAAGWGPESACCAEPEMIAVETDGCCSHEQPPAEPEGNGEEPCCPGDDCRCPMRCCSAGPAPAVRGSDAPRPAPPLDETDLASDEPSIAGRDACLALLRPPRS